MKKIHARQVISLRIFMVWLKKIIHTREMLTKKNSCGQEPITPDAAQKFATLPITFSSSRRNLRCCVTVAVTEIIASLLVCLCQSPIEKWRPSSVQQKDKWRTDHVTFPPTTYNIYNHIPRTRSSYTLKLEKSVVII